MRCRRKASLRAIGALSRHRIVDQYVDAAEPGEIPVHRAPSVTSSRDTPSRRMARGDVVTLDREPVEIRPMR